MACDVGLICMYLCSQDCPAGLVQEWLKEIAAIPQVLHHAKFWIVKALLAEESGESNDAVVDIFETAFRHKVEVNRLFIYLIFQQV